MNAVNRNIGSRWASLVGRKIILNWKGMPQTNNRVRVIAVNAGKVWVEYLDNLGDRDAVLSIDNISFKVIITVRNHDK